MEVLIGALLDRARARGVATPRLDLVYSAIKPLQDAAVRKYAEDETHKQHIADWLRRRPAVAGAGLEGRKAWERALRASEKAGAERVKVQMARGVPKGEPNSSLIERVLILVSLQLPVLLWRRKKRTRTIKKSRSSLDSTDRSSIVHHRPNFVLFTQSSERLAHRSH